ncbi:MAG: aspartate--tRNA ligase [Hyphomicrobiales bacterium]|nr:aspartate--tRNA ligase [Hyphomicrobiales bacterium]
MNKSAGKTAPKTRAGAKSKTSSPQHSADADAKQTPAAQDTHAYRSHTCGALRKGDVGAPVRLSGWVHRVRDHGGLLFFDLRDHYGLTQCVIEPESPAFKAAERCRSEWVVRIDGEVVARSADTVNANMPTGEVEIRVTALEPLSEAGELPLPVFGDQVYPEETRLKYRFLDLRRDKIHRNIMKRSQIISALRRRMTDAGFFEFQTPILTASSPEGARDFLVPSRMHPGKFYALPQAPQQFKQLIMMAGFDRYFQIAPCFRDEDARADRSPGEFYQLDIEMSFVTQEDVFGAVEPVLRGLFEEFGDGKPVTPKFPHIPYDVAIAKYGSDKPDLRNPIEMQDVSEHFRGSGFKVFAGMLEKDAKARVWAIPAPGGGSRAFCDRMNSWAQQQGQPGLGYIFWKTVEGASVGGHVGQMMIGLPQGQQVVGSGPVANNLGPELTEAIRQQLGLKAGDAVFFAAGDPAKFYKFAGEARTKVGTELNLIAKDRFEFCWITDFPFYEWNEEDKKIDFSHNPFSMPQGGMEALTAAEKAGRDALLDLKAFQYDIVCNGVELSSGAIRNHKPEIMYKAFEIAGYGPEVVDAKFGGMIRALKCGAPPHGGIAPGVDRIVMLLCGEENLREVTMFPLNQQAQDLLMGAPSEATAKQLQELHIRLNLPKV